VNECAFPKVIALIVGMSMLALAVFGLSPSTIVESTFAQDVDTTTPSGLPTSLPPPLPFDQLSAEQIAASTNKACTLTPSLIEVEGTPQQTQGPYFVDDMPNRSDIRSDTSDSSVQGGVLLNLTINVYDVDDNDGTCTPLKDAQVDIWQANSQGVYSGVTELGTGGKDFLRGYQVTDDNGTVRFTTVYPGWYEGRAIHIHVKVRLLEELKNPFEWTSQFYLNNSINELIHKQSPYSDHGPVNMLNEEDGIYAGPSTDGLVQTNAGKHLMLNLTQDQQGNYIGNFIIGVNATTQ
jgi:protocatechuate 3,4-dioxygenase beta subunit